MFIPENKAHHLVTALLLSSFLGQPLAAMAADNPVAPGEVDAATPVAPPDAAAAAEPAAADDTPNWQEITVTGDWGGARKRLYDAGVQADLLYTADYLYNTTGGLQRGGAYVGHADIIVQFDGEKLFGWKGGSGYLQLISNSGGRPNLNYVGSLMGIDNFEAPVNRSGIFKAWLQQSFLDDKASVRVGLYPIDSEFYVTDSSGVFLHPSFGMAAEAANFGSLAGPSIYATSSYGARLRIDPDPAWYAMLAVTRGIPSDRIATSGPNISWQNGSGSMLIGELGLSPAKAGWLHDGPVSGEQKSDDKKGDDFQPISKLALGAWRYTPQFPQLVAVDAAGDPLLATHWGAYLLAEQSVYRVPRSNRDLAAFVRYGFTDGTTSTLAYSVSVGLSSRGTFASREKDSFGIAVTRAHADPQGRAQLSESIGAPLSSSDETALEVTYRAQVLPGVVVQPVVQRIVHPNLSLPNSTVAGVRVQMAL
ncbi:Carbohydrate-selective porin OprB [Candidatus Accumulibacter aalborgensis]|uniref:Carbohydrate-selective porin OprB n=1 Tax=Candidatus Accumulibacter aalborgensis TaxID=1860102 RepID=A0A1A8XFD2_9PROT|nr:carbohydrate porin [Candidatus Accumulibacter aalborgensis]SBT03082.1 Carbohydrate-selective porin OprB [Candidatus Accumulibacter aalborgensis]